MSRGEQDGNVFLAGICGLLERGGGPKWGCGGDVDVDVDHQEGCWRLKFSSENFVDF